MERRLVVTWIKEMDRRPTDFLGQTLTMLLRYRVGRRHGVREVFRRIRNIEVEGWAAVLGSGRRWGDNDSRKEKSMSKCKRKMYS